MVFSKDNFKLLMDAKRITFLPANIRIRRLSLFTFPEISLTWVQESVAEKLFCQYPCSHISKSASEIIKTFL